MTSTTQTQPLPTGTWELDPSGTTVTVSAKHLGAFTVPATMKLATGRIEIGPDQQIVLVDVAVDAASYASSNAKRNEHVAGADFLDADHHPTIEFHAISVVPAQSGYRASGTVTVKGTSTPIDVEVNDIEFTDDSGRFAASASIDREAIGIDKFPSFVIGRTLSLEVAARVRRT